MAKPMAEWITCNSDTPEGRFQHTMLDYCWDCAPYWWNIPICPTHRTKLKESGFCKHCRKYYNKDKQPIEAGDRK